MPKYVFNRKASSVVQILLGHGFETASSWPAAVLSMQCVAISFVMSFQNVIEKYICVFSVLRFVSVGVLGYGVWFCILPNPKL